MVLKKIKNILPFALCSGSYRDDVIKCIDHFNNGIKRVYMFTQCSLQHISRRLYTSTCFSLTVHNRINIYLNIYAYLSLQSQLIIQIISHVLTY